MAIIPAEPKFAFWNFSKLLSDLLCWATHPDNATLNIDWQESYKDRISDVADSTILSVEHLGDESLVEKIKAARRLGFEFATLLCDRPALSTVAVENWTVPRYRQLFDDLSALEHEFKLLGDAPTEHDVAAETASPNGKKPDGPFGTSGFRWHTREKTGLRPDSFQLVSHLWNAIDRTSTWDDLAEPVFDEHEGDYVTSDRLGSVRRDANKFFQTKGFPFKVKLSVRLRKAELEQMPE